MSKDAKKDETTEKKCPFCGSTARFLQTTADVPGRKLGRLCRNCNKQFSIVEKEDDKK